ncbi:MULTISPECIES: hypothetical protein [unclassified Endozoicomonas]|uniref:hypothetical protein n=1 Tax=unclassified Endozoicomonas TaxID=2644528 RepID=UPI003BB77FF1
MKKLGILFSAMVLIQGCSTTDINQIASDAVSGAIDGVLKSTTDVGSIIPETSKSRSYSVESKNISIVEASKTKRELGKISITKTEKNPKNQTKLVLDSCMHPRIGTLRCGGYIFEVTSEGWLKEDPITFDDLNYPELTLAAGKYYIKALNWETGRNRFVTGEFTVKPFVTNLVSLELE